MTMIFLVQFVASTLSAVDMIELVWSMTTTCYNYEITKIAMICMICSMYALYIMT